MPHTKQAKKRVKTDEERRLRNKAKASAMRTHIKRVQAAVESGDKDKANEELIVAQKKIDKAAKTRVIHPNKAARTKAQLAKALKSIG